MYFKKDTWMRITISEITAIVFLTESCFGQTKGQTLEFLQRLPVPIWTEATSEIFTQATWKILGLLLLTSQPGSCIGVWQAQERFVKIAVNKRNFSNNQVASPFRKKPIFSLRKNNTIQYNLL